MAAGPAQTGGHVPEPGLTWRNLLKDLRAFGKILWWQGVRSSYRGQFWTQLLGMLRQNPSRFMDYVVTCAMGVDLIDLRTVVRQKVAAIIKERKIEVPAAQCRRGAAF